MGPQERHFLVEGSYIWMASGASSVEDTDLPQGSKSVRKLVTVDEDMDDGQVWVKKAVDIFVRYLEGKEERGQERSDEDVHMTKHVKSVKSMPQFASMEAHEGVKN